MNQNHTEPLGAASKPAAWFLLSSFGIMVFNLVVFRMLFATTWYNVKPIYGIMTVTGQLLVAYCVRMNKRSILAAVGAVLMGVQAVLQLVELLPYYYFNTLLVTFHAVTIAAFVLLGIFFLRRAQHSGKGPLIFIALLLSVFYVRVAYEWISYLSFMDRHQMLYILQAVKEILTLCGLYYAMKAFETGESFAREAVHPAMPSHHSAAASAAPIREEPAAPIREAAVEVLSEESEYEVLPEDE